MGVLPTIPDMLSEEGQQFVSGCLQHNPYKRATVLELLEHNFIKVFETIMNYYELIILYYYSLKLFSSRLLLKSQFSVEYPQLQC